MAIAVRARPVGTVRRAPQRAAIHLVREILRGKKGSIRQAPLPKGLPSWEEVLDLPLSEIERRANADETGYRTIRKLLKDKRFDR